jgi:hypothetical protein
LSKSDKARKVQEVQTVLEFTIAPFATSDEGLKDQLTAVVGEVADVDNLNPAPAVITDAGVAVDGVTAIANTIKPAMAAWDPLLEKIKLFTEIVDGISEVWRKCRRSPSSSHARGLFDSRSILMQKWHGPSCLLRRR